MAYNFGLIYLQKNKAESSGYMAVQGEDVPEVMLQNGSGILRVLVGKYDGVVSKIPTYSDMFAYHLKINAQQSFTMQITAEKEVALIVTHGNAVVNDVHVHLSERLIFKIKGEMIHINNNTDATIEMVMFGGEKYMEPVVMGGPFVMNSQEEMEQAYHDYDSGKYGEIIRG